MLKLRMQYNNLRKLGLFFTKINNGCYTNISLLQRYNIGSNLYIRSITNNQAQSDSQHLIKTLQRDNRINLSLIKNTLPKINLENFSEFEINTLLTYCGNSVPYYPKNSRNIICQLLYKKLISESNKSLHIYHKYIEICTENNISIDHKTFLSNLNSINCDYNDETLKKLLHNSCETNNIKEALSILNVMKDKGIALDENDFNALIKVHTIDSGLAGSEIILDMMQDYSIPKSESTIFAIFNGLAIRNKTEEFLEGTKKLQLPTNNVDNMLQIIENVGLNGNLDLLQNILAQFSSKILKKEHIIKVDHLCIHLINMQRPKEAMIIYEQLISPVPDKKYAHFLLREMFLCDIDTESIVNFSKHIRDAGLNDFCLENTTEIALRLKKFEAAKRFFYHFSYLRPHFFWPLLIDATEKQGEKGVLELVEEMIQKNVEIDRETLSDYILPHLDLNNFKLSVKKLQDLGITTKDIIVSLLVVAVNTKNAELINNICKSYDVPINDERLINILPSRWLSTKNTNGIIMILQKLCEANSPDNDLTGNFLLQITKRFKFDRNAEDYLQLVQSISEKKLRINSITADTISQIVIKNCTDENLASKIVNSLEDIEDLTMEVDQNLIIHPRKMNIEQLECHLEELKYKNMETRGVLRKLIQQHTSVGNMKRVDELQKEFAKLGYKESAGMKSSLMHTATMKNDLKTALNLYDDLVKNHSNFKLDEYKIIDLVTLMVKNDKYKEAKELLINFTKNRKIYIDDSIKRNCLELLLAIKNAENQQDMFNFLIANNFCKPSNVILGPLVRVHLNKEDIEKATETFSQLSEKYKCTPLQLELMKAVVKLKNQDLLQRVINAAVKIHGDAAISMNVIAALAEEELKKDLIKFLSVSKKSISLNELSKRCNRWIVEKKIEPLYILRNCIRQIFRDGPEINIIERSIMKYYGAQNDCESALSFYEELQENQWRISKAVESELCNLFKKCKRELPETVKMKMSFVNR